MAAPYDSPSSLQSLIDVARQLRRDYLASGAPPCPLAPLVLMSDRDRTPDLPQLAARLPIGSALIYREIVGAHDLALARELRDVTRTRGLQLLIGSDAQLARDVGADGVHLPRSAEGDRPTGLRIVSRAGSKDSLRAYDPTTDAVFISAVFPSASASAGTPIGLKAFSSRVARSPCPVFALGGVTAETAPALIGTGATGLASIDGLARALREDASMTVAKPKSAVTISKNEGGELITYTATVEGESATGELTLRRVADGVWNANHTGVPKAIGGRGVGKALVEAMSADAQAQGWRIIPGCPFVAKLFERKPELAVGIT